MTTQKAAPDDWPAIIREINIPVRELSARTGIDKGTISRIARGEIRDPRDSTARTLRNLLQALRTNNAIGGTKPPIAPQGAALFQGNSDGCTAREPERREGEEVGSGDLPCAGGMAEPA